MAELEIVSHCSGTVDKVNHLQSGVQAWQQFAAFFQVLPSGAQISIQVSGSMNDALPFEGDLYDFTSEYRITIEKIVVEELQSSGIVDTPDL